MDFILISLMLLLFMNMIFLKSPIMMLLNILGSSLMMSWIMSLMYSNWFAYMIFLIYVGGMLVMFSYFVALTPNQFLNFSIYSIFLFLISLIFSIIYINKIKVISTVVSYNSSFSLMYENSFMFMLIFLILILLIIMLFVVKLVDCSKGPLRPFKYE